MLAFLFPGQGSQSRGMGRELFDTIGEFTRVEPEIDRLLGYSIRGLCANGPESLLKDTRYTQPAMFVVNALYYYDGLARYGRPAAVAGHSLGEYNALLAAGAFDLVGGVRLVARRAELMAAAPAGAMAAVLNMASERVGQVLIESGLADLDVANCNTALQTVIAGPPGSIARAVPAFERHGASCIRLPVGAAFHSRYMSGVGEEFGRFLQSFTFGSLTLPVVSNVTGRFYPNAGAAPIRSCLTRQITQPVLWLEGIRHLQRMGVTTFRETGPGRILTRLCQQIEQQVPV